MTLRKKSLFLTGSVLLALLAALYFVAVPIVRSGFARVEEQGMKQLVQGATVTLSEVTTEFDSRCNDWAAWDDTYLFVQNGNLRYIKTNLHDDFFANFTGNTIVFLNSDAKLVYGKIVDDKGIDAGPLPSEVKSLFRPDHPLLQFKSTKDKRIGIISTTKGPLLLIIRPVITSHYEGPIQGTIIFGRYLNSQTFATLGRAGDYTFDFTALGNSMPADFNTAWKEIESNLKLGHRTVSVLPISENNVGGYTVLNDIYNHPAFMLRITSDRKLFSQGQATLSYFTFTLFIVGIIFLLLALWPLERFVLSRLSRLNREVQSARDQSDLGRRVTVHGHDELAQLSENINATFAALEQVSLQQTQSEELYRELAETARNAGDAMFVAFPGSPELEWYGDVATWLEAQGCLGTRQRWLQCIHADDRSALEEALQTCEHDGTPFSLEIRVVPRDGELIYWLVRAKALRDEAGDVIRIIGVCLDTSAQKKVEAAHRESQELLARVVETNADAIILLDANGCITFANAAAERTFGINRQEILSRCYNDKRWGTLDLSGAEMLEDRLPFAQVLASKTPVHNVEFSVLNPHGRRIILSVNASPLHNAEDEFTGVICNITDITERKAMQERLVYQAFHDPLTGLSNRVLFTERLEHALSRSARNNSPICVAFIDLDNFKYVNDSLGHAAGDRLLELVARRLQTVLRAHDTASRFGGDEFVVLIEDVKDTEQSLLIVERLLATLHEPILIEGREIFVTPSIGVTFSRGKDQRAGDLMRQADVAMYEAKRRGKARYEIFEESLDSMALHRLETENDLRRALQRKEFVLHYQPKIDLTTNQIYGFEALVRWQHPQNGLLMPNDFIPLAEETGLIVPLGAWVLREACTQAKEWQEAMPSGEAPVMSVNLSLRQLMNLKFPEEVGRVLLETEIEPETLVLEITEHTFLQESDDISCVLNQLKSLGVQLAIDDFGMGYSSISYLRKFPPHLIKIDRKFVNDLHKSTGEGVIVSSMISLAHALNLAVVAEGAETWEEVQQLKNLGCNRVQGYYFANPMSKSDISELLSSQRDYSALLQKEA